MAYKKYVAAVDQGTTGTRFIIFDKQGNVISSDYEEHKQIYPKPGWVEHNPLEIWEKTQKVIKRALEKGKINPSEIAAIGVTDQRETTVLWNPKTGEPYYNAIVWQDTRTRNICQKLTNEELEPQFKEKTGLPIVTYFSGSKIKWMLDNIPKLRDKAEKGEVYFGNIDSWIIWNLTGGPNGGAHITDYTNASRTMLMNLKTLNWDKEQLKVLGIPGQILPTIRPSSDKKLYGYTKKSGPLGAEIPVAGDLGDQQAALFGQTCYTQGEAKNTYGTGCFLLLNTGDKIVHSKNGMLTTVAYGLEEGKVNYALEGSIAVTGAAVQWLRDNLKLIKSADETEEIATSVKDSGGIYFVPAFSGLFAPYWDMYARGVIIGLTRYITKAHIVRAALESEVYQTKDVILAMEKDSGISLKTLKVDGGAVKNNFLCQIQSDILGTKVIRPTVIETTALGSAYAAGLAVGFWSNLYELRKNWKVDREFNPSIDEEKREKLYKGWLKAVSRSKGWEKD